MGAHACILPILHSADLFSDRILKGSLFVRALFCLMCRFLDIL